MSGMQIDSTEHEGELKISVRLKGKLAEHVIRCTEQDGFYDNKGEYIRDLVRKDIESKHSVEDHLHVIWQRLFPGLMADESEFEDVTLEQLQKLGRERAGLIE